MTELRPFRHADWGVLLDLANQAVPFAPQENVEWLEHRKAFDVTKRIRRHYIAAKNETPVGYGCLEQQSDCPDSFRIYVVSSPANLRGEVGNLLYTQLLQDAKELRATNLWAREFEKDGPIREFFTSRGFTEVQRFTIPDKPPMVVFKLGVAG